MSRVRKHPRVGYIMLIGSLTFTAAVAAFAYSSTFYLALVFLFIGGMANTIFFVVAMTVLQLRVPEKMRGRVMGIYTITFSFIPLGGMMGGLLASIYDERFAVLVGVLILAAIYVVVGITQPIIRTLSGARLDEV